ncbi:MAG: cyclic nucleotide-binding domain-containing protein [Chromatiaceae bacterium]|jgi:CRP-like cAMP-binding protein|nr:cyclic nucleotide-binding domain-containing protein [Chromatiaceae bacterium]
MREVLDLATALPEQDFAPGGELLSEGGRDRTLYVLIEGEVEVLKGDTQVNTQSEPGSIFGELAVLLDVPHTATVRAVTPCRAYVVEDGAAFLRLHPELAFHLARLLARKLNSITSYLVDLKRQYQDQGDHLGMVDEVLESLLHQPAEEHAPGSDRYPDKSI